MRFFFFIVAFFIFCSCKPSSKGQSQNRDELQKIVKQEIGENASTIKNTLNTFVLATREREGSIDYAVIRLSDNKVVLKSRVRGAIGWSGDMQLKESRTPGMVKKDSNSDEFIKLIDLNQYVVQSK